MASEWFKTASAFALARTCTMSEVLAISPIDSALAATASSSTCGAIVIGSMPALRSSVSRAGEVLARTN